jgi:hypothetical protein
MGVFVPALAQAEILRIKEHPGARVPVQVVAAEFQATPDVVVAQTLYIATLSPRQRLPSLLQYSLDGADASRLAA